MGARKDGIYEVDDQGGGGGTDVSIVDGTNPLIKATVFDYPNSNPVAVNLVDTNGDPLSGSAVSIADGADVAEGSIADVAVQGDNPGTVSAKLRGLNKSIAAGIPVTAINLDIRDLAFATDKVDVTGSNVGISGSVAVTGPLTDTQLRATPVPVSGTVAVSSAAVTIADGADVAEGATTGAAVFGDVNGTVNARLRGISTILNNIWDQTNTWFRTLARTFWNTTAVSATTTWTSATALNTAIDYLVTGQGLLLFRCSPDAGAAGTGKISFYASKDNGTSYELIPILYKQDLDPSTALNGVDFPQVGNNINPKPFSTASPYTVYVDVLAYTHIRIKLTSVIVGALNFSFKTITSANPSAVGPIKGNLLYGPPINTPFNFGPVSTTPVGAANALVVAGGLTNGAAVPAQLSQLGVLPTVVNAVAPSIADGAQALISASPLGSARTVRGDIPNFGGLGLTIGALNEEVFIQYLDGVTVARVVCRTAAANLSFVFEGTLDLVNYFPIPAFAFSQNLAGVLINQQFIGTVTVATTLTGVYLIDVSGYVRVRVRCSAFTSGTVTVDARATAANPIIYNRQVPSTLHITAVGAANAIVTATLPAAGPGLFHYITSIQCKRASTALLAGTAVLTTTSTNLPGNPAWSNGNVMAAGDTKLDLDYQPANPLKSLVANTATTIVMPAAGAAVLNRINVSYFVGF